MLVIENFPLSGNMEVRKNFKIYFLWQPWNTNWKNH